MRALILLTVSTLLIVSCASKPPYSSDYPLTDQYFYSRDKMFFGKIPIGWFSSTNDTLAKSAVVWLLKEDFTAAITIRELILDYLSSKRVQKQGLKTLALISAGFRSSDFKNANINPMIFNLNGKEFCSYEFTSSPPYKRIVVFSLKGRYYECESVPLKGEWTKEEIIRLFIIQQSVLSSIKF